MDFEEIINIINENINNKTKKEKKEIIDDLIYKLKIYYCKPYFIKSKL